MLKKYLSRVFEAFNRGDAREESYYTILEDLLSNFARETKRDITIRILPKETEAGNPDFRIWSNPQNIVGYIEAKAPTVKNLDEIEHTEQLKRYLENFPNLILTNFLEFRLYRNGRLVDSVMVARQDALLRFQLKPPAEHEREFKELLERFFSFSLPREYTAETLAEELAKRTHFLKDIVLQEFNKETENGSLHGFYDTFKKYLITDLTPDDFVDLFSQTIVYGLFAARMRSHDGFDRAHAYERIPKTIGILRELFKFISYAEGLPEQMEWTVDDIVSILAVVDVISIFEQYYHSGAGEDPVVYFYETFLATYDPKERAKRGVYYTPKPVVDYIVNSVNEMLKEKFNISSGIADRSVTVLDPAAGTLSFITEAVKLALKEYTTKFGEGGKHKFIKEHILNDFYAFELMMAPYAVGHLKFSFILEEEGYKLSDIERPKFYLTNTLEMKAVEEAPIPLLRALSEESHLAERVKREIPILVIMGNPPYFGRSTNINEWTEKLLKTDIDGLHSYYKVDGKPLNEKNPKWLQDDYVKFIRFAQWKISQVEEGIIGFITNHSYLDNPTFRGMRQSLMKSFSEIYVLDLHGNAKKKEKAPDGSKDENVFDIQQGAAIAFFIKKKTKEPAKVYHADLWGERESKYDWLLNNSFNTENWKEINPASPFYFFVEIEERGKEVYERFVKIAEIFPVNNSGIVTSRDNFVIDFDIKTLKSRIEIFRDLSVPNEILKDGYGLKDKANWKIVSIRKNLANDKNWEAYFQKILYRPFDIRFVYYNMSMIEGPRQEVMRHMLKENLGLCIGRAGQVVGMDKPWNIVFVSNFVIDFNLFYRGGELLFPLYLCKPADKNHLFSESETSKTEKTPNIKPEVFEILKQAYCVDVSPENIFYYIYAVLYSNVYREKYKEFLKVDFPRVPFTKDYNLFMQIGDFGKELVDLHLLKSAKLNNPVARYMGMGEDVVEKVVYNSSEKRVYINKDKFFEGIEENVFTYQIGGYKVMNKWLKSRRGRILSLSEIETYCKIATAIFETIHIQSLIDQLYENVENSLISKPNPEPPSDEKPHLETHINKGKGDNENKTIPDDRKNKK